MPRSERWVTARSAPNPPLQSRPSPKRRGWRAPGRHRSRLRFSRRRLRRPPQRSTPSRGQAFNLDLRASGSRGTAWGTVHFARTRTSPCRRVSPLAQRPALKPSRGDRSERKPMAFAQVLLMPHALLRKPLHTFREHEVWRWADRVEGPASRSTVVLSGGSGRDRQRTSPAASDETRRGRRTPLRQLAVTGRRPFVERG
jgi:hypothetical protein